MTYARMFGPVETTVDHRPDTLMDVSVGRVADAAYISGSSLSAKPARCRVGPEIRPCFFKGRLSGPEYLSLDMGRPRGRTSDAIPARF